MRSKKDRKAPTGRGTTATEMEKIIGVLNYEPTRYGFLSSWMEFYRNAEAILRKKMAALSVDALNAGTAATGYTSLFDPLIQVKALPARANGLEQYENHCAVLRHQRDLLRGEEEKIRLLLEDLEADRQKIGAELDTLRDATR